MGNGRKTIHTSLKPGTSHHLLAREPTFERTPRYLTRSLGYAEGKTWNPVNIEGLRALQVKFIAVVIYTVLVIFKRLLF